MKFQIISDFLKQLLHTCLRFPIAIACAVIAFVLFISYNHFEILSSNELIKSSLIRLSIECIAGISLFYSFHIYAENKNLDFFKKLGFILLGLCLLGLHFYSVPSDVYNFALNYTLRYFSIILCFHLVIAFSLYNTNNEIEAFWQYNEFLFVRFMTSLLFSFVLFLGISGAVWAVKILFDNNIGEKIYLDIFAGVFLIFNTVFFFNMVPFDTHHFEREKSYQNSLRIFVQYILIPIVLLYGIILAIYSGKILMTHILPNGWVAVPILIFSVLGILAYLLIYPIRETQTGIIAFFNKYFFYIMLPFIILYFISLIKRVQHYGFTEERYLAIGIGIWLIFVTIYTLVSKLDNIIFFPISLCILLALASFGPWGMYKFSAYSQYNRMHDILEKNNLINSGKLAVPAQININEEDSKNIESIINYLYTHNELGRIKKLLNEAEQNKIDEFIKQGFDERNVGAMMGLLRSERAHGEDVNYFTCTTTDYGISNFPVPTFGFKKMMQLNAIDHKENNSEIDFNKAPIYFSFLENNNLYIINKQDTILKTSVENYANVMKSYVLKSVGDTSFFDKTISKIAIPYRQQYYSKDSMLLKTEHICVYVDEVKCLQATKETKVIAINGYAIF